MIMGFIYQEVLAFLLLIMNSEMVLNPEITVFINLNLQIMVEQILRTISSMIVTLLGDQVVVATLSEIIH